MVRKVRHYLNNLPKNLETSEERLRLFSSTLENSTNGNTLRKRGSPSNSHANSLSSINVLNNSNMHNISTGSMVSNAVSGVSTGNGILNSQKSSLFGKKKNSTIYLILILKGKKNRFRIHSFISSSSSSSFE